MYAYIMPILSHLQVIELRAIDSRCSAADVSRARRESRAICTQQQRVCVREWRVFFQEFLLYKLSSNSSSSCSSSK